MPNEEETSVAIDACVRTILGQYGKLQPGKNPDLNASMGATGYKFDRDQIEQFLLDISNCLLGKQLFYYPHQTKNYGTYVQGTLGELEAQIGVHTR